MPAVIDTERRRAVMEAARRAATAARRLACLTEEVRNRALVEVAAALETQAEAVLEANARDREAASAQVAAGEMSEALFRRLLLDEAKLETLVLGIRQIARMPDPVGQVSLATELDEGLELFRVTCPIGVVGVIFESRPEALPQIASLCLKSGNAVVLKGGSEAAHSNRKLAELIRGAAVNAGAPSDWLTLLARAPHPGQHGHTCPGTRRRCVSRLHRCRSRSGTGGGRFCGRQGPVPSRLQRRGDDTRAPRCRAGCAARVGRCTLGSSRRGPVRRARTVLGGITIGGFGDG